MLERRAQKIKEAEIYASIFAKEKNKLVSEFYTDAIEECKNDEAMEVANVEIENFLKNDYLKKKALD